MSRPAWSQEQVQEAVRILGLHETVSDASHELGITPRQLQRILSSNGLGLPSQHLRSSQQRIEDRKDRIIVASDFHIPHTHEGALADLIVRMREWKPAHLVLAGDIMDCASISRFVREPGIPQLVEEVELGKKILQNLHDASPDTKIHYLEGNHEYRLHKLILAQAPGLHGLPSLNIPAMLELGNFGISWHPYGDLVQVNDYVAVTHGSIARKWSAYTARALFEKYGKASPIIIQGHTHRAGMHCNTDNSGTYVSLECGCMCDPEHANYIVGPKDWQVGFLEIDGRQPWFIMKF